ncbi:NUDIX domain-containing protein [Agrilactobacillus yilanensis]|uniref:NUDIX domain-containing protein n=1 Tax=Agrilactobacillus yilanensis TaxID=2485997 RepID=A0ABW4J5L1_9LACO
MVKEVEPSEIDEAVFGTKEPELPYKTRIGAYIIIPDAQHYRMLLVTAPNGALLLPGGEMESGEDQLATLKRELLEEAGFQVTGVHYLGRSGEYYYSHFRQQAYYNPGYFYVAESFKKIKDPLEDFNNLIWLPIPQGLQGLKRPTHQWAVEKWLTIR